MRTDLLVNDFVLRAVRDKALVLYEKEYKRNVLHVKDCAWAFQHAMKRFDKMKGNAYNVGDSRYNISKGELAEMIQARLPKTKIFHVDDQKDPDQRNYIVSNDKIEKEGFRCQHDLPSGIDELIRGYAAMSDRRFRNI
jgi:nucleoside-diphosphate-sugar epimerase